MELTPGARLDQYEIVDEIARSGMATLYRAIDHENGKTVVLKVPHLQFESDLVFHERFRREEAIGRRLSHPAVIKVFEPKQKSRVYIPMEFVRGQSIGALLRKTPRLPIDNAVELAIQIADALVYLHANGVVHRDLKPDNVMIDPYGRVKLMDFGIASDSTLRKMTWSGLSQSVGTPDYMAPEQVKGQRGDARVDVYALGAMLYEMLTGRVPYPSDNTYAALRAKTDENPQPPRELRADIPPELEETILKALERDPTKRQDSAFQLREELAHPQSVVMTNRAARERSVHRFSGRTRRWLEVTTWVAAGLLFIAAFATIVRLLG